MSETITISVEEWARLHNIATAAGAAVETYERNKQYFGTAWADALFNSIKDAAKK